MYKIFNMNKNILNKNMNLSFANKNSRRFFSSKFKLLISYNNSLINKSNILINNIDKSAIYR